MSTPATTTAKTFASQADLEDKVVSFTQLSDHAYAYTAEGDPNTGIVIGDNAVMVIDTQATPVMAADVIRRIRQVTDKPIRYVVLSHYHAVRVLGASAYAPEHIIASEDTLALIKERGEQDKASEIGRFPRLFRNVESVPPGLTWPTLTFSGKMTLWLGQLEVQLLQLGRGHTAGDTVVWLPQERILFSGDLVEFDATPYAGDAHFADWPKTLDNIAALNPAQLVPGRGPALQTAAQVAEGLRSTGAFISDVYSHVQAGVAAGHDLTTVYRNTMAALRPTYGHWVIFEHCMPFDVSRAFDEASQHAHPRIWTAERDIEMWKALES
jgi:glyoxylase-like metal-dependent hydrolase (beta-lactamase superfamily II)